MFNYPKDFDFAKTNVDLLEKAEQNCDSCGKWYEIPLSDMKEQLTYEKNNPGKWGIPMKSCTCSHCNKNSFIILPGKYDRIGAKNPELQRYTFKK